MILLVLTAAALAAASPPSVAYPDVPTATSPTAAPAAAVVRDSLVRVWVEPVTAAAGSVASVPVKVHLPAGHALGALQVRVLFDPSLLVLERVSQGDFRGMFQANTARAGEGRVVAAGASADTTVNRDVVTVMELVFRVVGSRGARAPVRVEVVELVAAGDFTDLAAALDVREGSVLIR